MGVDKTARNITGYINHMLALGNEYTKRYGKNI
jgi:hypothetical protein